MSDVARIEDAVRAKQAAKRNGRQPRRSSRPTTTPPTDTAAALEQLRSRLGQLDRASRLGPMIDGTYRNGDGGSSYGLVLAGRDVDLGTASRVLKPRDVQAAILDTVGIAISVPRLDDWADVAELIVAAAELRDVTLTPSEETAEWIGHYLSEIGRLNAVDVDDTAALHAVIDGSDPMPFRDQAARLYLRLPGLLKHVTVHIGQRTTAKDLSERLGGLGFTKKQLSARRTDSDHVAKLRVWQSRPGFDPAEV